MVPNNASMRTRLPVRAPQCSACSLLPLAARSSRSQLRPLPRASTGTTAAALPSQQADSSTSVSGRPAPLPYELRVAVTPDELRSAAYLRALSFYTYPPGRSEFSARVSSARGECME